LQPWPVRRAVRPNLKAGALAARLLSAAGKAAGVGDLSWQQRNNALVGSSSADTLDGRGGSDALDGRAGDDTLIGGGGADRLTGGTGADVFLYQGSVRGLSTRNAPDAILDFRGAQGDKISLAGVELTGAGAPGSLTWADGTAAPWGVWQAADMVGADTNGDGKADLSIRVQGASALAASDFLGVSGGGGGGGTPGFRVVLSDDFSRGYAAANWGNPFHGGTYWNGAFDWSAADVAVRGGELQVTMTRHADGSWTAGGLNSFKAGKSIHYGTVEFDARVEEAQGTMTAILMWPASDDHWPPEIDILETPQADVMHTLH